jgi:signal transduction histidine kinase
MLSVPQPARREGRGATPVVPPATVAAGRDGASPAAMPPGDAGLIARAIRTPILHKLVVADVLINVAAYLVLRAASPEWTTEIMIVSLAVTLLLNAALVWWALLPLRELEATARRVSQGDLDARVAEQRLADRDIARIGATLNKLLDGVTADRRRMRQLASQVISAGDQERAHIARELHDSTAQQLSALEMLVTTSLRDSPSGPLHERLGVMREIVVDSLAEVRALSHNVHPRVLDDLGLVAALEFLARRTREQSGLAVHMTSDAQLEPPPAVASVLYRVAQEAVRNAVRHAQPRDVTVRVAVGPGDASLTVTDDGSGFDLGAAEAARRGMGLFVMRERMALIAGTLEIESTLGKGTSVRAHATWAPDSTEERE